MTGAAFSEVDVDLLADYVGGALDGTPDEAVIARLVADDPAWRAAHDDLVHAVAAVTADLRAFGAATGTMPQDVVGRLTVAMAGAASSDPDRAPVGEGGLPALTDLSDPSRSAPVAVHAGGRHLAAVPDDRPPARQTHRAPRRRRMLRWAAPIAVAAGVLAFAGLGLNNLLGESGGGRQAATSDAGAGPEVLDAPYGQSDTSAGGTARAGVPPVANEILATGTDYQPETLASRQRALLEPAGTGRAVPDEAGPPVAADKALDASLRRLSDRTELQACVEAIAKAHAGGAISVQTVDYARFQGKPALVVLFAAGGQDWTWVSGPECGTTRFGADTRFQVRVR